ncbi:MAG: hypothetical protein IJ460_05140 [Clostridia bacterium]|nr:hypothetical protein [Clostridia bacterium]
MANKKENKNSYNSIAYKHGNLMTASTVLSLCTLMVLMLISTAFKSSVSSLMMARSATAVISALFFAAFVILAVMAKKKDCCLWEYSLYSLVMSIGFLCMLGTPFFLPATESVNAIFRTKYAQAGIIAINVAYLLATLIYHTVKSNEKKK